MSQGHWGTVDLGAGLRGPNDTGFAFQYGFPTTTNTAFIWGDNQGGNHSWQLLHYPVDMEADLGWHHFAATKSGNTITIYFDGASIGRLSPGLVFSNYRFNIGRDTYNTDNNHRSFFGAIDDVRIYNYALTQDEIFDLFNKIDYLAADSFTLHEAGGTVNFELNAGWDNANRQYLLFGSVTGTGPGTPLPGGVATLPLNWDLFTNLIIGLINSSIFHQFQGKLDGEGNGTAQLNLPTLSGAAGLTMHFAYALNKPWDFASNPVPIEIVP